MRFDRDRWYSSENRRAIKKRALQESSSTRRVISLVLLLAMILVVMQQLADRAKYEPAFRAIGLSRPDQVNRTAQVNNANQLNDGVQAKVLTENLDKSSAQNLAENPNSTGNLARKNSESNSVSNSIANSQNRILVDSNPSESDAENWANLSLAAANPEVDRYAQVWNAILQLASPEVVNELATTFFEAEQGGTQQALKPQESTLVEVSLVEVSLVEVSLVEVSEASRLWLARANERVANWMEAIELDNIEVENNILKNVELKNQDNEQVKIADATAEAITETSALGKFPSQWAAWSALTEGGVPSASAALSDEVREGLRIALDRRLLKSIRDASPWRPVERPTLLRTLQRATEVKRFIEASSPTLQSVLKVEVPLLTKQTNDLRGRLVRMRGRPISNATTTEASSASWGTFAYDVVWIYPDDNSQQPVCIYAIKSPEDHPDGDSDPRVMTSAPSGGWPALKAEQVGKINANSASVEVTGFFIKRLAFASPRGVDIAPVLIVSHSRWVDDNQPANNSSINPEPMALATGFSNTSLPSQRSETIDFLSKSAASIVPWREPGVHRSQLRLLNEVLGEPLKAISDEILAILSQATLNPSVLDDESKKFESKKFEPVLQVLYQLPRLQKPLMGAMESNKNVGPAKLTRLSGIALEWLLIPLDGRQAIATGQREIYRVKVQPISQLQLASTNSAAAEVSPILKFDNQEKPFVYAFVNSLPGHWKKTDSEKPDSKKNRLQENESPGMAGTPIWQPVILEGLMLELDSTNNDIPEAAVDKSAAATQVMLCNAPNWSWRWAGGSDLGELNPSMENIQPSISIDWQQLGAVGWDLSAIRFIQSLRGKPVAAEEAEAFYSLIDAAEQISAVRIPDSQPDMTNTEPLTLATGNHSTAVVPIAPEANTYGPGTLANLPTITALEALQGGPSSVLGRVATRIRIIRVTRIDVPEEINRQNLDGTEYYELDGLADIGQQVIQLKSPDGSGDIRFAGRFPMTLVAKSVPDWLLNNSIESSIDSKSKTIPSQNLQQGVWYPSVNVDIEGIFYRLWSYSTGQTAKASEKMDGAELRQIGPLVAVMHWTPLGDSLATDKENPKGSRSLLREVSIALVIAAAVVWFAYRFQSIKK